MDVVISSRVKSHGMCQVYSAPFTSCAPARGLAFSTDEDVVLCPDIFSTGLSRAESGNIKIGDAVAVFAQGPIGLCATVGAKLKGASLIIGVDSNDERLAVARRLGANVTLNTKNGDPVPEIKRLTEGRGVDVAIEACTPGSSWRRTRRSTLASGIKKSSRRSVLGAKNECDA